MFRYLLLLAVAPLVAGCGTMANMNESRYVLVGSGDRPIRPYGGVANDFMWIEERAESLTGHYDGPTDLKFLYWPLNAASIVCFSVVDLPLSLAGDTITLPWAIWKSLTRTSPSPLTDEEIAQLSRATTTQSDKTDVK